MNRPLIFIAAMATAAAAITSACLAEVRNSDRPFRPDDLHFTLNGGAAPGQIELKLSETARRSHFSNSLAASSLGITAASLERDGPISFAMVRDAGRVDCHGLVSRHQASGPCRFTANAAFGALLSGAGVPLRKLEDSYAMTIVGVNRALVEAVRNARFGPTDAGDLIAMAAVGVTPDYIRDLSARGYRPGKVDDIVAFKAVGVTPDYVDGLSRAGVDTGDGESVIAMRALAITPDFVAGFARIGYAHLAPDKLVELKALGVTPAMVQTAERDRAALSLPQRAAARSLIEQRRR